MTIATTAVPLTTSANDANDVALSLTGRPYVSWSQVDQMRRCPRKFAYRYVEAASPAFVPSSLLFGKAIHAAIEHHLRRSLEGLSTEPEALLSVYRDAWSSRDAGEADVPVRFNKDQDETTLAEQAGRVLDAFHGSELASLPGDGGDLLAVEESLVDRLDPDLPDVLARVDAVWRDQEALHVIDFKTSRSRWSADAAHEHADQLLLYQHLARGYAAELGLPIKLHFGVLGKQKTPSVQRLEAKASEARLQQVLDTLRTVWQAIQGGHFYANPSPMNCTTCPYQNRCPAYASK
jgi:putative RecB family exonuclease